MTEEPIKPEERYAIEGILPHNVPFAWHFVWPFLEPSINTIDLLDRPYPQDIIDSLMSGERQLWVAWDRVTKRATGCVITELNRWPEEGRSDRVCHIWAAGGRGFREYVRHGMATLRAWAAAQGCAMIIHGGRRGWQRIADTSLIGNNSGGFPMYGVPVSVH